MTTGHVLMGLLRRGQQHGYDLKRRHDELFASARPMAFGQVYAALGRLVDKGWVRPVATEQDAGPERTVFELTDTGLEEVRTWSRAPELPPPHIANPLASKLKVALLDGGQPAAREFLRGQRDAHMDRMRQLTRERRAASVDLERVLAVDYALGHLDADIRWMDETQERLDEIEGEHG